MLAIVDDGMGTEDMAQPKIGGEIAVGRHKRRVVIGGLRIDVVAARRLNADDDIAEWQKRQMELLVHDEGIILRRPPAVFHCSAKRPTARLCNKVTQ